jgi:hypothetical protein
MGAATYESSTDYDGCVGSGSIKIPSIYQYFYQCTAATADQTYAFGFAFKGLAAGEIGDCTVQFYGDSGCTTTPLGSSAEANTAAAPNTTTWIAGNGIATSPAGATRALFNCANPLGSGYYDRMYFRLLNGPGGF